ncbi:hypothetical protein BKA60DRAFT_579849 [Fusarium oxysporum]|nr:hypothetical protein BKA60DRAFT_579849 [Fusarium oxysporum]
MLPSFACGPMANENQSIWNFIPPYQDRANVSPTPSPMPSPASSYGSCDTGFSYPPRQRKKRRKIVNICMTEFDKQESCDAPATRIYDLYTFREADRRFREVFSQRGTTRDEDVCSDENPTSLINYIASVNRLLQWKPISESAITYSIARLSHVRGFPLAQEQERGSLIVTVGGEPDFAEAKVWAYVKSFKDSILIMHPIIHPVILDRWTQQFLDALSGSPLNQCVHILDQATSTKRKRSPYRNNCDESCRPVNVRAGRIERSIHNALILTILAVGTVCLYNFKVPTQPYQRQPVASSQRRRRNTLAPRNNPELVPGLEYFALATSILGNVTGDYRDIKTIYANIFASIYHGQLSRPVESFSFINEASHKLQVIMRPSLGKLRQIRRESLFVQNREYNQLVLTFWTCLQLESDLLVELPLPPSGLLRYEDEVPYPNLTLIEGVDRKILDSYAGQIRLRAHIKKIHRMFYIPESLRGLERQASEDDFEHVELVADAVSNMGWVAPYYAFTEYDPPAHDLLAARLRDQYWHAQIITYRPFIRMILEFNHNKKKYPASPNVLAKPEFRDAVVYPTIAPSTQDSLYINPNVIDLARRGIKALIESTRVFHGLGDNRPIITNVFGTAHAQWGNILILRAACEDPVLSRYVGWDLLSELVNRTIHFLRLSATGTSSLQLHIDYLLLLKRVIEEPL